MKAAAKNRRDRVRAMLADLKMPGALEAADDILAQADGGSVTAGEALEKLLGAQIELRFNLCACTRLCAPRGCRP